MRYTFYERNDETTVEAGQAVLGHTVEWKSGSERAIRMLSGLYNWRFDGKFDQNNLDHWKSLPSLIGNGSRFWVEVSSGIVFKIKATDDVPVA